MNLKYKDGREVEIIETHFELGEGCSIVSANFADNGEALADDEMYWLESAYQAELYQSAYEDMASAAYDQAKDARKYGDM